MLTSVFEIHSLFIPFVALYIPCPNPEGMLKHPNYHFVENKWVLQWKHPSIPNSIQRIPVLLETKEYQLFVEKKGGNLLKFATNFKHVFLLFKIIRQITVQHSFWNVKEQTHKKKRTLQKGFQILLNHLAPNENKHPSIASSHPSRLICHEQE